MYQQNNDHLGTSGILMGVNAPPLYDACLVGRWEEVLEICGVDREEGMSNDTPTTETTHCSSSAEILDGDPGFPEEPSSRVDAAAARAARESRDDGTVLSASHPCLQTRYADRRRNTPLHLACRRQPPTSVVRALLNNSPCEAISRRTADGLTPLHFAAYCGADVEVVSLLVDRMRSDAAVGRAMRLSSALDENEESADPRWRVFSEESVPLPPTRLLDRRQRTPLHCALSGFRTPIRPLVVRKLLSVDPASATLGDERGRTPLSLLFDDYAEEIMEALEDDVSPSVAKERIEKGGELYECWKMLSVLLQAAYQGSVSEEEEGEKTKPEPLQIGLSITHEGEPLPQDRPTTIKEVNVMELYDQENFSIVHAAAGVWECPAPLAKLVLKCLCSSDSPSPSAKPATIHTIEPASEDWDHHKAVEFSDVNFGDASPADTAGDMGGAKEGFVRNYSSSGSISGLGISDGPDNVDVIRQRDEETMRLPLHIAVCARPQGREGYSARLKVWLSSSQANTIAPPMRRNNSRTSVGLGDSFRTGSGSLATHPDRGRSLTSTGQVYNARFGRSPSRDSVVAYSSSMQRRSQRDKDRSSATLSRAGSSCSLAANIAREPFLQHTMVRDVLSLYPEAASVVDDRTGKLPIVLAIEHGKSWETAVGPLLEAFSQPFGGGGDGGMALPDDSPEAKAHRDSLQAALFLALSSPESHVREEAIRTVGKLAEWGGVYGMPGNLDGIVSEWLDTMVKHGNNSANSGHVTTETPISPEGIVVGPGASGAIDWIQNQSSHLIAVAEVLLHSRPESVSDRVARLCLDAGREYLNSKDGNVREAAARVLGNTLNSVGDADDAANVMREVVLNLGNDDGTEFSGSSAGQRGSKKGLFGGGGEDVVTKHGRLLACNSILLTQWGGDLLATPDICDAIIAMIHGCIKDKNTVVRSAAYHAIGPLLGKSHKSGNDISRQQLGSTTAIANPRTATSTLKEMRSDILRGTRASEQVDVQLALARGLTSASRMHPDLFLCKGGMPVMDAALMLAMSSSVKRPNVQKAFQIFLWVSLQMGVRGNCNDDSIEQEEKAVAGENGMSPGLEKYIGLAEGENGRIMMKFVTQTLAKIEDLDDQGGL